MKAEITAIEKHTMITWFTPIKISRLAVGISTLDISCQLLQPLILPASITSGGIALNPSKVSNIMGGTATTIVIITAAWSPTPKRTSAGTNTAYCGIVCITNKIGYRAFSTRLLL